MRTKVIKRCIDLLEGIKILTKNRNVFNNCNYVISGLKVDLERNNLRSEAMKIRIRKNAKDKMGQLHHGKH